MQSAVTAIVNTIVIVLLVQASRTEKLMNGGSRSLTTELARLDCTFCVVSQSLQLLMHCNLGLINNVVGFSIG